MKEQSKQWTSPNERSPKKAKTVPSAGKVMATVFWVVQGIIFTDYLEKGARWVPRLLTVEQKRNCMTTSEHCLDMFKRNPKEFLWHFVTIDETWIHLYTPEKVSKSELHPANVLQKSRKRFRLPETSWPPFFRIRKASSSSNIWRREGQSRDSTMLIYWADSRLN